MQFFEEANIVSTLKHPNIIKMFGVTLSPPRLVRIVVKFCFVALKYMVEVAILWYHILKNTFGYSHLGIHTFTYELEHYICNPRSPSLTTLIFTESLFITNTHTHAH